MESMCVPQMHGLGSCDVQVHREVHCTTPGRPASPTALATWAPKLQVQLLLHPVSTRSRAPTPTRPRCVCTCKHWFSQRGASHRGGACAEEPSAAAAAAIAERCSAGGAAHFTGLPARCCLPTQSTSGRPCSSCAINLTQQTPAFPQYLGLINALIDPIGCCNSCLSPSPCRLFCELLQSQREHASCVQSIALIACIAGALLTRSARLAQILDVLNAAAAEGAAGKGRRERPDPARRHTAVTCVCAAALAGLDTIARKYRGGIP